MTIPSFTPLKASLNDLNMASAYMLKRKGIFCNIITKKYELGENMEVTYMIYTF